MQDDATTRERCLGANATAVTGAEQEMLASDDGDEKDDDEAWAEVDAPHSDSRTVESAPPVAKTVSSGDRAQHSTFAAPCRLGSVAPQRFG
jgi:hypothetical protein